MARSLIRKSFQTLPAVTHENRAMAGVLLFFFSAVGYSLSNHYHLREPVYLPLLSLDLQIPFLVESIWIYLSEYLFFAYVFVTLRRIENVNRYVYSFLFQQFVAIAIFLAWPTTYPREMYPLPQGSESVSHFLFHQLRTLDTPASSFPSLHVSSVFLSMLILAKESLRAKNSWVHAWGTLIILSTLTTKQHYVFDVLAGLCLALSTDWFFNEKIHDFALSSNPHIAECSEEERLAA